MGHRLTKIYTRTGDDGSTGLGDGTRVQKEHLRVEAYGTVDEANSAIGVLLAVPGLPEAVAECLTNVQHELFDLGGELSVPGHRAITERDVARLEQILDRFNESLPPLKDFILLSRRTDDHPAGRAARLVARPIRERRRGSSEVPEPAVGPAVRAGAGAGTARARLGGTLAP
jgi:ATP:cob(I)alamin adenosyltransferase